MTLSHKTSLQSQLSISSRIPEITSRGSSFQNYTHIHISNLRLKTNFVGDGHIKFLCPTDCRIDGRRSARPPDNCSWYLDPSTWQKMHSSLLCDLPQHSLSALLFLACRNPIIVQHDLQLSARLKTRGAIMGSVVLVLLGA